MPLDDYQPPKGAYFNPALIARFDDISGAEEALAALRTAGFTTRDIQVSRDGGHVTVIVSEPTPGMLETAKGILDRSAAAEVRPYGSGADQV